MLNVVIQQLMTLWQLLFHLLLARSRYGSDVVDLSFSYNSQWVGNAVEISCHSDAATSLGAVSRLRFWSEDGSGRGSGRGRGSEKTHVYYELRKDCHSNQVSYVYDSTAGRIARRHVAEAEAKAKAEADADADADADAEADADADADADANVVLLWSDLKLTDDASYRCAVTTCSSNFETVSRNSARLSLLEPNEAPRLLLLDAHSQANMSMNMNMNMNMSMSLSLSMNINMTVSLNETVNVTVGCSGFTGYPAGSLLLVREYSSAATATATAAATGDSVQSQSQSETLANFEADEQGYAYGSVQYSNLYSESTVDLLYCYTLNQADSYPILKQSSPFAILAAVFN